MKTMALIVWIYSRIIAVTLLTCCMSLTACDAQVSTKDDAYAKHLLDNVQERQRLVIGQDYSGHLEYFDGKSDFSSRTAQTPLPAKLLALKIPFDGSPNPPMSNDEWSVKCHGGSCLVRNTKRQVRAFSVVQKRLLTPIYWSPDESLGFYLQKGPTWRSPARCSMEDERDIVLVDTVSGKQGVVRTVCGGFPYDQLRWFTLPK